MILLAQADVAKAAQDIVQAESILAMTRACLVLVAGLAAFFFYKWQEEVAKSRAEDKEQIKLMMEAKGKETKS